VKPLYKEPFFWFIVLVGLMMILGPVIEGNL